MFEKHIASVLASASSISKGRQAQSGTARLRAARSIRNHRKGIALMAAMMTGISGLTHRAHAQTLTWDPSNNTVGSDGNGTWNAGSGTNFASGGTDAPWSNGNAAVFGAGGTGTYNVTVGTAIVATSLKFNAGASYVLTDSLANGFTIGGGAINFATNVTLANFNLSGAGGLTFNGASGSVLTLTGSGSNQDSLTGAINVSGGILNVNYSGISGFTTPFSGSQTINVAAGAQLIEAQGNSIGSAYDLPTVNVNGGTFTMNGGSYGAVVVLTGGTFNTTNGSAYNAYSGSGFTTLASSVTSVINVPLASGYESNTFNVSAGSTSSGFDAIYAGVDSGSYGINKSGAGVLEITGVNTDTGTNTISGGTVTVASGAVLGASSAPLVLSANTSLGETTTILNVAGNLTVGSLSSSLSGGGASVTVNAAGYFNDSQGSSTTFAGLLNASGGMALTGTGSLTLATATLGGATTLAAGSTLAITGSTNTTALTLNGSKFLLGTSGTAATAGDTFSSLTLNAGASIINAYVGSNTLALGSITRASYATLDVTLPTGGGSVTTTTPNSAGLILGGWVTVNGGSSWAVSSGSAGSPGALSAFSSSASTYSNTYGSNTSATDFNANATGAFSVINPYVNSLQFNTPSTAVTATVPFGFKITSGGILNSPSAGPDVITGGSITSGLASGELFVNQWNASGFTINSSIVNNGGTAVKLVKAGTGVVTLGGVNSYTGGTYLNAGAIAIANPSGIGTGTLYVGLGAASATSSGSTNQGFLDTSASAGSITVPNNIVLPAPGSGTYYTLNVAGANNVGYVSNFSGVISGGSSSASLLLTDNSSGDYGSIVELSGTNTFTAGLGIVVERGSVAITSDAALGVDGNAFYPYSNAYGSLIFLNPITFGHAIVAGGSAFSLDTQGNAVALSGAISSGAALTKLGVGTLTLNSSSSYTGVITVGNGIFQLGATGYINGSSGVIGSINLGGGTFATATGHAASQLFTNTYVLPGADGVSAGSFSTGTYNLSLGTITRSAGSTLNFTLPATGGVSTNTANGATSILGGWATVGGNTFAVSAGTGSAAGAISGLPLASYSSSYSSATSASNFDATASGTFTPTSVNALRFNTASAVTATLNGAFVVGSGGILESAAVGGNATTITGGTSLTSGTSDLVISNYNPVSTLTISTSIVNSSTGTALTVSGPGTVVLGTTNTYNGSTYVVGGATLSVSSDGNLGTAPSSATAGSLVLNNGTILATSSFALNNSRGMTVINNGTINIASGALVTYGGVIAQGATDETSTLTITGAGTLALTGVSTFTGGTIVNGGTLNLSSGGTSPVRGPLTINSGGTVYVNGFTALGQNTTANPITVNAGGTMATANGPVSFNSNFVLNGGLINGSGGICFSGSHGITSLASSTTANISTTVYGYSSSGIYFNVASGTTSSGIDLNVSSVNDYSGTVSFTKNGPGAMNFGGGSMNGSIGVNSGTLELTAAGSSGGALGNCPSITVNSGATFIMNGTSADELGYTVGREVLTINGGTVSNIGYRETDENNITMNGGTINANVAEAFEMLTTQGFTATSDASGSPATITGTGSISLAEGATGVTFTVNQGSQAPAADMVIAVPIIDHSGTNLLIKNGTGTLEFTGANTYSGGTTINAGTIQIGNGGTTGTIGTGAVVNNAALVFDVNSTYTVGNAMSGSGSLTQVAGSLTLTGASTYTGLTIVAAGKLYVNGSVNGSSNVLVGNGSTLGGTGGISGPVTLSSGASLEAGAGGVGSLSVGSLVFNGAANFNIGTLAGYASTPAVTDLGTLSANGSNNSVAINLGSLTGITDNVPYRLITYTGGSVGGTTGYPAFTLNLPNRTNGYLTNTGSEIDVTITGADYLNWTGATNGQWDTTTSNWALNSSNAATTYIDSPGDSVAFGDSGVPVTVGTTNVLINTGTVHPSSITFNNSSATYTISSSYGFGIAGTTGITKYGTGTVNLNTSNSFTGAVAINGGLLNVQNASGLGTPSSITVATGGALKLVAGATIGTGPISLSGNGSTGSGALESAATNTIAGLVSLSGSATIASDSGTLALSNTGMINGPTFGLTLAGAGNGSIAGVINTSTGGLVKTGSGIWTLNGADTYTGATNVSAGTLIVNAKGGADTSYTIAAGALLEMGYSTVSRGGTYGGSITINGSGTATPELLLLGGTSDNVNNGFIVQTAPTTVTTYGTGTAGLFVFDTNSTQISIANAASGTIFSSTINLQVSGYGLNLTTAAGANTATGDLVVNGAITGSPYSGEGLNKKGTGSVLITAAGTYANYTAIQAGSIILSGGSNRLPVADALTLGSGTNSGVLLLNGVNQTIPSVVTSGTGTANAISGNSPTLSTLTINYNVSGGTDTYAGTLGGSSANLSNLALVTTGQGTIVLSATSNYSGGTTVNQGTLTGTAINSFGTGSLLINPTGVTGSSTDAAVVNSTNSIASAAAVTVNTNSASATGTLNFNGLTPVIGSLTGNGSVVLANTSGTTLTTGNATNTAFSGIIGDTSGSGMLVKAGTGTFTLTGSNTYGGGTNVSAGTLLINSSTGSATGSGPVTVALGATLGGVGSIPGVVTVNGTLFTGLTNNTLNKSSSVLTLKGGSSLTGTLLEDLIDSNGNSDQVVFAGGYPQVNLGGTLTITNPNSIAFAAGQNYDILNYNGDPVVGAFSTINVPALGTGLQWNESALYTTGVISVVVGGPANLIWGNEYSSTGDGSTWAAGTSPSTLQNFQTGGTPAYFSNNSNTSNSGDNVTFDDTGGNGTITVSGVVTPSALTFSANTLAYTIGVAAGDTTSGISGPGSVTLTGSAPVTFASNNNYTGGTTVSSVSKLILASANAFPLNTTLSNSGIIDITKYTMALSGASISTISAQVSAAYNNGAWNGSSGSGVITSSTAAGDTTHLTAVGVATGLTSFEGQTVPSTDVLVKYTYYGDANLDGKVDGTDYSRIDNGVSLGLTGWYNGDFNYDGVINGSDYTLIDNSYNSQGALISAEVVTPTAQITGATGASSAAVPEPTTFALVGIGAMGLLGRRRRRA